MLCRGLVIDRKKGNILKIDRHKYVKTVHHGLRELLDENRKAIYSKEITFSETNFVNIDTTVLLIGSTIMLSWIYFAISLKSSLRF